MADWSMLEYDMIGEILVRVDDSADFLSFSLVCRTWNHASSMVKSKWRPSMPYLLLPENTEDNPDCVRNIFDLTRNKCYQFRLPETFGARCWGSQYGWIMTLELDRQIFLFNPLTKARIRLPPQSTMPGHEDSEGYDDDLYDRTFFITNVLVIKDVERENDDDDDFVVLAIVDGWKRSLAFARPDDETWTSIDPPEYTTDEDYWPGFDRRHMVTGTRVVILFDDVSLGYLDISDLSKTRQEFPKVKKLLPGIPKELKDIVHAQPSKYLLLSDSSSDLSMVFRFKEDEDPENYETKEFEVYRLNSNTKKWERLDKLGDVAFFVGVGNSLSVRAPVSGNFRSNCIYFTDDYVELWNTKLGGRDIGVFDYESKQIDKFYKGDNDYSKLCPPIWFTPLL